MRVTLRTSNSAAYFNVLPPGSNHAAIFVGSTSGNQFTGTLPADGEYKLRVYLMRSAARRNEHANYTYTVGIPGQRRGAPVRTQTDATGNFAFSVCASRPHKPGTDAVRRGSRATRCSPSG